MSTLTNKESTAKTKIPTIVCEYHQDVIQFIHRYIARKKLPFTDIKMVHLDSHPDLAYPNHLSADDCFQKETLYDNLDIADWILPLMYQGHLGSLVWIKPPWAKQMDEMKTAFEVGKDKESSKLKVSCTEDYFLEDGIYSSLKHLRNIQHVKLQVSTIDRLIIDNEKHYNGRSASPSTIEPPMSKRVKVYERSSREKLNSDESMCGGEHFMCLPSEKERYILDIDLDFFSVTNPFLQDYTQEEYRELKDLYHVSLPHDKTNKDDLMEFVRSSSMKLHSLKTTINNFAEGNLKVIPDEHDKLVNLLSKLKKRKINIDWELVHSAGMTTELPHHVSNEQEMEELLKNFEKLLSFLPRPTLITVARSAVDEYCPPKQVDWIEKKVLDLLSNVYQHNIDVHLDYKDTDRLL